MNFDLGQAFSDFGDATGLSKIGGIGQTNYHADPYKVNQGAYNDPNAAANKQALAAALQQRQGLSAPKAGYAGAKSATINGGFQNQMRQGQQSLIGALQQQANGQGPSLAQGQFQRNLDQAIAAQRSGAASARGISPGMAQRLAAQNMGQMQGQGAIDAGQMRMQEQLQARQQLAGVLGDARNQDIGMATNQAQLGQQTNLANAGFQQQTMMANQQAALEAQKQKDAMAQYYSGAGLGIDAQSFAAQQQREAANMNAYLGVQGINAGIATGNASNQQQLVGGLIGAGGAGIATAVSDERAKENIADAHDSVDDFLDNLKPKSFDYKDPKHGGKNYVGFMAQDAERSALGKALVKEVGGVKTIDTSRLLMALTASNARLNERLRKVEAA